MVVLGEESVLEEMKGLGDERLFADALNRMEGHVSSGFACWMEENPRGALAYVLAARVEAVALEEELIRRLRDGE